nr:Tic22 family protein [[Phormidium] sp. ETS-05]
MTTIVSTAGIIMKSLLRWGAVLGLMGSVFVGISPKNMKALALPENQIIQKLSQIPVFTITNQQGSPLVASISNGNQNTSVAGVFISKKDADNFIQKLTETNPEMVNSVQVRTVSLADVYQMERANPAQGAQQLAFDYVPVRQQVDSALAVLEANGQQVEQFNGVPLFLATGGQGNGYLTIQQGEQQVIPLFFNKEDLQGMLDRLRQQDPNLAQTVNIKVVNLRGLIKLLQESNDEQLNKIVLIPSRETIEYLQSQQQPNRSNGQQSNPTNGQGN